MHAELRDIERAVASGTREAGRGLRTELRRQLTSAGLGQRLANSWRDRHYPNQHLDAATLVYTKAPQIIRAFDEGAVIRSKRGRFLAIPTENAPRKGIDGSESVHGRFRSTGSGRSGSSRGPVDRRCWWSTDCAPRTAGEPAGFAVPARNRSGAAQRSGPDHGGDVPARPAGEALEAAKRASSGRALVGTAAGADRAAA
jgi:hypothetical protein